MSAAFEYFLKQVDLEMRTHLWVADMLGFTDTRAYQDLLVVE